MSYHINIKVSGEVGSGYMRLTDVIRRALGEIGGIELHVHDETPSQEYSNRPEDARVPVQELPGRVVHITVVPR